MIAPLTEPEVTPVPEYAVSRYSVRAMVLTAAALLTILLLRSAWVAQDA